MSGVAAQWPDVFTPAPRTLLIVNSAASQMDEIARAVDAIDARCGVANLSVIAPAAIGAWFLGRGVAAARLLPFDVELGYFLQSDRATQWAVRQRPDLVLGTEPYAPNNEEVKHSFELRVAPLVGSGRFVVHSLPGEQVFVLPVEDLWGRAARQDAVSQHQARVRGALDRLHDVWRQQPAAADGDIHAIAGSVAAIPPVTAADVPPVSVLEACRFTYDRLYSATVSDGAYPAPPIRVVVDPPATMPRAGWLTAVVKPVRSPALVAGGVRWRGSRLAFRGEAEGPYAYLLQSKPTTLNAGDAAIAEGHVHQGGVTIGLVKDGRWAGRVDVVDRGPFLAAAIAVESGPHALIVAHCLHGVQRRAGIVLRRFGWARV